MVHMKVGRSNMTPLVRGFQISKHLLLTFMYVVIVDSNKKLKVWDLSPRAKLPMCGDNDSMTQVETHHVIRNDEGARDRVH